MKYALPPLWVRLKQGLSAMFASLSLVLPAFSQGGDVVDELAGRPEFSTLVSLVQQAGLENTLRNADGITVFAPTNAAFAASVPDGELGDILAYHVLPVEAPSSALTEGFAPTLLSGFGVDIDFFRFFAFNFIFVDDARVVRADIEASNGVIHAINRVLDPSVANQPTLLELVNTNPDFSTLASLIDQAGLSSALDGPRDYTVFAPTNAAFETVPSEVLATIAGDPILLRLVLWNHIAAGTLDSSALALAGEVQTFTSLLPIEDGHPLMVGGIDIIGANVPASNGIVHVIDGVLVPKVPQSLVHVASDREDLSTFVTALTASGLAPTFDSIKPDPSYTIFAPDNDAFAALDSETLDQLLANPTGPLADILRLHVVEGTFLAEDLFDGQLLTSLSGETLRVTLGKGVQVNGVPVIEADLRAANGVIHILGGILQPLPTTVADLIAENPQLSTLNTALELSGLDKALADPWGSFTVFAPSNAAFGNLPPGLLDQLLQDPQGDLTDILSYHVVTEKLSAEELINRGWISTLLGPSVTVENRQIRFFFFRFSILEVNGVRVISRDIEADNGTIHIIDGVLLPPAG